MRNVLDKARHALQELHRWISDARVLLVSFGRDESDDLDKRMGHVSYN